MPAPYRYVIDRPGTPGVDAIDGTAFSAWIQPADQTAALSTLSFAGAPALPPVEVTDGTTYVIDPPTPPETYPEDLNLFAAPILAGFGTNHGSASAHLEHEGWLIRSGAAPIPGGDGDDDPFYEAHVLRGDRGSAVYSLCVQLAGTFWNGDWQPPWPEGAIGYEVQMAEVQSGTWGPYANPLSASLDITMQPSTYLGQVGSGVVSAFALNDTWGGGDLTFDLAGLNATVRPAADAAETYAYEEIPVPIEGIADPVTYSVVVSDLSAAPPYTGLLGLHASVKLAKFVELPSLLVGIDNQLEVNANVSVAGTYVIRPPRIRWIYAEPQTIPYRRTYPRDDALAGGAARTWPPPTAIQSSNRTFGGYL